MKAKFLLVTFIAGIALLCGCSQKQAVQFDENNIYEVARYGNEKAVNKAVKKGASVNERDANGFTPLYYAVCGEPEKYADALNTIIKSLKKDNDAAVFEALKNAPVTKGNALTVKALLKNGANIALNDRDNRSAFLYAALFCSDTSVLESLLAAGADYGETITINQPQTLMAFASFVNTSPEVISYLAKKTGDADKPNTKGTTPIMWAAMYNSNPDVIDTLIKEGADINDNRQVTGRSPYDWAVTCNVNQNVIDRIADKGGVSFVPKYKAQEVGSKKKRSFKISNGSKHSSVSYDGAFEFSEFKEYDKEGKLVKTTANPYGEPQTCKYEYDKNGNCIRESYVYKDPVYSYTWNYSYNSKGQKIKAKYLHGNYSCSYTYSYNDKGDVIQSYADDNWGPDAPENEMYYEYTYDSKGRKITMTEKSLSISFGKFSSHTTYIYDEDGNLESQVETSNSSYYDGYERNTVSTVHFTYDNAGRLVMEEETTDETEKNYSNKTSVINKRIIYDYDFYDSNRKEIRSVAKFVSIQ